MIDTASITASIVTNAYTAAPWWAYALTPLALILGVFLLKRAHGCQTEPSASEQELTEQTQLLVDEELQRQSVSTREN